MDFFATREIYLMLGRRHTEVTVIIQHSHQQRAGTPIEGRSGSRLRFFDCSENFLNFYFPLLQSSGGIQFFFGLPSMPHGTKHDKSTEH